MPSRSMSTGSTSSRAGETGMTILKETKVWLTMLDKFCNGTPIPSGVAGAAVELIRVIENVKKHKEDCYDVANLVYQISEGILEATSGMKEEEMNGRLVDDLRAFQRKLDTIRMKLHGLTQRSLVSRIFKQEDMLESIAKYKTDLRSQIDIFNIRHGINMQRVMNTQFQMLNVKLESIDSKVSGSMAQGVDTISLSSILPPPPEHFYGRDKLMKDAIELILTRAATNTPARIPIMGTGGIGKTTISRAIAHSERICDHFQSHRYFVACDTVLTAHALIKDLLVTFQVPSSAEDPLKDFLPAVRSLGSCLLILDNFETPWDHAEQKTGLATLLGHLNSLTNLTLIVTMRGKIRPDGVSWSTLSLMSLPPLDLNHACDAFSAVAGIEDVDESELQTLMGILDGVPLAIVLMAKLAQVGGNLSDLINQWKVDQTAMLADQIGDRLRNVEYSIQLSVESPRMQQCPEAFALLQIISMLPNGVHKVHLEGISGTMGKVASRAAHVLQEVELVYKDRDRLKVLSPIRAFIQSKHPPDESRTQEVKRFYWNLMSTYSTDISETGDITLIEPSLLHAELGNTSYLLNAALKGTVDEEIIQATYDLTTLFYWTTPSNELLQALLQKGTLPCDLLLKAKCFQLHSDIASRTGDIQQAAVSVATAKNIFEQISNQLGVAQCLQSSGDIAKVQNHHKLAIEYFKNALELFRKEGGKLGVVQSLLSLAQMECITGSYDSAQKLFEEAFDQFEMLEDQVGSAQCLVGLGEVAQAQDNYPLSLERYSQARKQFLSIGHAAGANQCLQSMAVTCAMQSQFDTAISHFMLAKDQFQTMGDILGVMQCTQALGDVARLQGRGSEAQNLLQSSRIFFQHFGDRLASVQCLQSLGDTAVDEGNFALGEDLLRESLETYEVINRKMEIALCLMSLGRTARKQGLLEQAEKHLFRSLAEFRAIRERKGRAECTRQIGLWHWAKGDISKALEDLRYSLKEFEEMGNRLGMAECQEHIAILLESTNAEESRAMLQEARSGFKKAGMRRKQLRCEYRLTNWPGKLPGEFAEKCCAGAEMVDLKREVYLSLALPLLFLIGSLYVT